MADTKELEEEREKIQSLSDMGNMYNFRKDFKYSYKTDAGLTPDIVREISEKKRNRNGCCSFG